ncbi:hypothetical protein HDV05_000891 [Chytridiales sp. JEL 0842]|nr:hypothetical protein HDV05_000891 [Chytridiales sp. JEL 0842]
MPVTTASNSQQQPTSKQSQTHDDPTRHGSQCDERMTSRMAQDPTEDPLNLQSVLDLLRSLDSHTPTWLLQVAMEKVARSVHYLMNAGEEEEVIVFGRKGRQEAGVALVEFLRYTAEKLMRVSEDADGKITRRRDDVDVVVEVLCGEVLPSLNQHELEMEKVDAVYVHLAARVVGVCLQIAVDINDQNAGKLVSHILPIVDSLILPKFMSIELDGFQTAEVDLFKCLGVCFEVGNRIQNDENLKSLLDALGSKLVSAGFISLAFELKSTHYAESLQNGADAPNIPFTVFDLFVREISIYMNCFNLDDVPDKYYFASISAAQLTDLFAYLDPPSRTFSISPEAYQDWMYKLKVSIGLLNLCVAYRPCSLKPMTSAEVVSKILKCFTDGAWELYRNIDAGILFDLLGVLVNLLESPDSEVSVDCIGFLDSMTSMPNQEAMKKKSKHIWAAVYVKLMSSFNLILNAYLHLQQCHTDFKPLLQHFLKVLSTGFSDQKNVDAIAYNSNMEQLLHLINFLTMLMHIPELAQNLLVEITAQPLLIEFLYNTTTFSTNPPLQIELSTPATPFIKTQPNPLTPLVKSASALLLCQILQAQPEKSPLNDLIKPEMMTDAVLRQDIPGCSFYVAAPLRSLVGYMELIGSRRGVAGGARHKEWKGMMVKIWERVRGLIAKDVALFRPELLPPLSMLVECWWKLAKVIMSRDTEFGLYVLFQKWNLFVLQMLVEYLAGLLHMYAHHDVSFIRQLSLDKKFGPPLLNCLQICLQQLVGNSASKETLMRLWKLMKCLEILATSDLIQIRDEFVQILDQIKCLKPETLRDDGRTGLCDVDFDCVRVGPKAPYVVLVKDVISYSVDTGNIYAEVSALAESVKTQVKVV